MQKKYTMIVLIMVLIFALAGCGKEKTIVADVIGNTENEMMTQNDTIAISSGPYGQISVSVPETWSYIVFPVDTDQMTDYGIILKPENVDDGQIELFCTENFGVCGTGLQEKEITIAGNIAHVGTYDENEHWDFIVLKNNNPKIVVRHTDCSSWTNEMWAEALTILDTMKFDEGKTACEIGQFIPESD